MKKKLRILLVEDSIDDLTLLEHLFKKESIVYTWIEVDTQENFERQLLQFQPDVIISDPSIPQFDSMEALKLFKRYKKKVNPMAAFILVTGTVSEGVAVKAIQNGADDYILKDGLTRLPFAIKNAAELNRLREERKKVEKERLQLLHILQKSQNELFVFNHDTLLFEYVNQEALNNLGYSRGEILKMTPMDLLHEFNEDLFHNLLDSAAQSKKGKIFETYGVRKDGSNYPIQIQLQLIQEGGKNLYLANVVDISESKEHEQQRELSSFIQNSFTENRSLESSLEMILEELCLRSSVCTGEIWASDFEGEVLKRFALWDIDNEDPGKIGFSLAKKALETKKPYYFDLGKEDICQLGHSQSECRFKSAGALPLKLGKEITAVVVMYDTKFIKERNPFINLKEGVQDKLTGNIRRKKTEEELRKLFELSPDILAILGKDGFIRKINPAIQKLLGYSNKEMLSFSFVEIIHPDDLHVLEEWRNTPLAENEVSYYECRWRAKNGKYLCFSWSVTPFIKEELHFVIGRDITQHKAQVNSIQQQNQKLSEIAWEQSHVVRAPLTRLMACISYLQDEMTASCEILTSIKDSAHEIDEILRTIVTKTEAVRHNEDN